MTRAQSFDVVGAHFPPWMFEENGTARGFYVELLNMMIEDVDGVNVNYVFYPVPRMLHVLSNRDNTFSLGIAKSKELEPLYKWVGPIYPRLFAIYKLRKRDDLHVESLKDLANHDIGVGRGYAAVDDLLNAGVSRNNIKEVTVDIQNVQKLISNRIEFLVSNDMVLAYLLKKEGYQWPDVEQSLILSDQYVFSYAFNKNFDDKIIQQLQQSLDRIKLDGRYDQLVSKYF